MEGGSTRSAKVLARQRHVPRYFVKEQETTMSNAINLISDPDVIAFVFLQEVAGMAAAIAKARELRPDILYLGCCIAEGPNAIALQVDIALNVDPINIMCHIQLALQTINSRETPSDAAFVLTV